MKRLNEAFTSTIIQALHTNNSLIMNALFKATAIHGFSFKGLKDSDIQELKPKEAFKFGGDEGDKYLKIWMANETAIAFCTWANTMIDTKFNWNSKAKGADKRIDANIIGEGGRVSAYLKSNSAINDLYSCYMIPFAKLGNYAAFKAKALEQLKAKSEFGFDSKILTSIGTSDPKSMRQFIASLKLGGFDILKVKDSDIVEVDPKKSFTYYRGKRGDAYIKIWMRDENRIAFCTWANTLFDNKFQWKQYERSSYYNVDYPGTWADDYAKDDSYALKCLTCYMIPFAAFGAYNFVEQERKKYQASLKVLGDSDLTSYTTALRNAYDNLDYYIRNSVPKLSNALWKYRDNKYVGDYGWTVNGLSYNSANWYYGLLKNLEITVSGPNLAKGSQNLVYDEKNNTFKTTGDLTVTLGDSDANQTKADVTKAIKAAVDAFNKFIQENEFGGVFENIYQRDVVIPGLKKDKIAKIMKYISDKIGFKVFVNDMSTLSVTCSTIREGDSFWRNTEDQKNIYQRVKAQYPKLVKWRADRTSYGSRCLFNLSVLQQMMDADGYKI